MAWHGMNQHLVTAFLKLVCRGVSATLCYDRPPPHFRPTPLEEAHELLVRLRPALAAKLHPHDCVAAMYDSPDDGQEVRSWVSMAMSP